MSICRQFKALLLIAFCQLSLIHITNAKTVSNLEPNAKLYVPTEIGNFGYVVEKMNIFCYKGIEKDIAYYLKSVSLHVEIEDDDFTCFYGNNALEVKNAHESHKSIFSFNIFSHSKKRNIKLNPFNQTCIGVQTSSEYFVVLKEIRVDLTKTALLIAGLLLFFLSSKLSNNSAFFYLCGVLLGVFASILVLIWFITKLIPKKPLMYGALVSGWALVAYVGQMLFENIQPLLIVYKKYVLIYIAVTSVVSFGICYYIGPPQQDRKKKLIAWTLQLLGLVSIYFSSDFQEAVYAIISLTIVTYYFPRFQLPSVRRFYHRFFPPKPRLLTQEEFEELGRKETEKALKDLREFVRSPNCKQWKVIKNLSQPTRFASFVEGDHHITHDETLEYDRTINGLSDDDEMSEGTGSSSESSYVDESIAVDKSLNIINKSKLVKPKFNKIAAKNLSKIHTSTPTSNSKARRSMINGSAKKPARNGTYELSEDED